jgi:hypothetical protein
MREQLMFSLVLLLPLALLLALLLTVRVQR